MSPILSIQAKEGEQPVSNDVYDRIRHDILSGNLKANERLKVSALAKHHHTSTNPVREALQQLRGEGLVLFTPNQGARVRPIDMNFVRDVSEIGVQFEPYFLRGFMETANLDDISELKSIQSRIEELNFRDWKEYAFLDHGFHQKLYESHYNVVALDVWRQHRDIMTSISSRVPIAIGRQTAIIREHQQIVAAIEAQDLELAISTLTKHVTDAGQHLMSQLQLSERRVL